MNFKMKSNAERSKIKKMISSLLLTLVFLTFSTYCQHDERNFPSFFQFIKSYKKTYSNSQLVQRKKIYDSNIERYIADNCTHCGVSNMTDWTQEQLQGLRTLRTSVKKTNWALGPKKPLLRGRQLSELPEQWDWRTESQMTPVKSQNGCGASWAFSIVAFFQQDSIINLNQTAELDLSEQFLIDCDQQSSGCDGGSIDDAMNLVINYQGLPRQNEMPYRPFQDHQQQACDQREMFQVSPALKMSYFYIEDEDTIKKILLKKPMIVSVCSKDFPDYHVEKGADPNILKCSPNNRIVDRTVLLVGYTKEYWIVKNHWGEDWGVNGYAYISKEKAHDCCIGNEIHTTGLETPAQECSIQGCARCVEENSCFACQDGKWISNDLIAQIQTCEPCHNNCEKCQDYYGFCKACKFGYATIDSQDDCIATTIEGCIHLKDQSWGIDCHQCHQGFSIILNLPLNYCFRNCQDKHCIECKKGYDICQKCEKGFLPTTDNSSQKIYCSPLYECDVANCTECDEAGKCLQCQDYMALISQNNTCENNCTIQKCLQCYENDSKCKKCQDGLSFNNLYQVCEDVGLKGCVHHDNGFFFQWQCIQCEYGFTFDTYRMFCLMICETGEENCLQCDKNDLRVCTECPSEYQLVQKSQGIVACGSFPCDIENCSQCTNNGSCLKCVTIFHIYNNETNVCQVNCTIENCELCKGNDIQCSKCIPGYVFLHPTHQCIKNQIDNCLQLQNQSGEIKCKSCVGIYKIDQDKKNCIVKCQQSNCIACELADRRNCTQCQDGYFLKISSRGLFQCLFIKPYISNCQKSNKEQDYCYKCKQFYYWNNGTKQCQANTEGCQENCQRCFRDYQSEYVDSDYVVPCGCSEGYVYSKKQSQCVLNVAYQNCVIIDKIGRNIQCILCLEGYLVQRKKCVPDCLVENCKQCESKNYICKVCQDGYMQDYGECQKCSNGCEICGSYCYQCNLGYQFDRQSYECLKINKECNNGTFFDGFQCKCLQGYYPSQMNSKKLSCNACPQSHCSSCSQASCDKCILGYFLTQGQQDSSQCQPCMANCLQCKSTDSDCSKCFDEFFFDPFLKQCLLGSTWSYTGDLNSEYDAFQCSAGCLKCNQKGECLQCKSQAYFMSKLLPRPQCLKCQGNCRTCLQLSLSTCLGCFDGYHFSDSENTCRSCSQNQCLQCVISTNICEKCTIGYYLNSDSECEACGNTCLRCNQNGCLECSEGAGLKIIDGKWGCESCEANCGDCSGIQIQSCLKCKSGLFMNNESECQPCPQNCSSCSSNISCSGCKTGYILRQGKCYPPCPEGCQTCYISDDLNVCNKCFMGYVLTLQGICQPDFYCNTDQSCKGCPKGFVLQTSNSTCIACDTSTTPNCSQCRPSNPKVCAQCSSGFFLQDKQCFRCQSSCKQCIQLNKCLQCQDGFYLQRDILGTITTGKCSPCPLELNCLTCSNTKACLSCNTGFVLGNYGLCIPQHQIAFEITLDMNFGDYTININQIRKALLSLIGYRYINKTQYINIYSVKPGSLKLNLTMAIPEDQTSITIFNKVKNGLTESSEIAGFPLISVSSIKSVGFDENPDNQEGRDDFSDDKNRTQVNPFNPFNPSSSSLSSTTIIVLAILLPIIVILLIIIGCIYIKYIRSISRGQINNSNRNQALFNQNNSTISISHNQSRLGENDNINVQEMSVESQGIEGRVKQKGVLKNFDCKAANKKNVNGYSQNNFGVANNSRLAQSKRRGHKRGRYRALINSNNASFKGKEVSLSESNTSVIENDQQKSLNNSGNGNNDNCASTAMDPSPNISRLRNSNISVRSRGRNKLISKKLQMERSEQQVKEKETPLFQAKNESLIVINHEKKQVDTNLFAVNHAVQKESKISINVDSVISDIQDDHNEVDNHHQIFDNVNDKIAANDEQFSVDLEQSIKENAEKDQPMSQPQGFPQFMESGEQAIVLEIKEEKEDF